MTAAPPIRATLGDRLNALGRVGRALHGAYYALPVVHRPPRVLLVLGHMRSGSTLLAHLLAAHDEIAGYGEAHLVHRSALDRLRLRMHVFVRQPQARVTQRYVMDKVVNEAFEVRPAVLRSPRVRAVLLLREPAAAMASLHRTLPEWTEGAVLAHYLTRMDALTAYAAATAGTGRSFALTHGDLVGRTDAVLAALTDFLGLGTPLRDAYVPTATTGRWGWGDTTDAIWAGRVVRQPAGASRPGQPWASAESTRRAEAAYAACLAALRRDARSTPGGVGRREPAGPNVEGPAASL